MAEETQRLRRPISNNGATYYATKDTASHVTHVITVGAFIFAVIVNLVVCGFYVGTLQAKQEASNTNFTIALADLKGSIKDINDTLKQLVPRVVVIETKLDYSPTAKKPRS